MRYEQGAADSLAAARFALQRAEELYERCKNEKAPLSRDEGPLFATLDNIHTCQQELTDFINIIKD